MILSDYFALFALAASLWLWWSRGLTHRSQWLYGTVLLTLAMGAWSIADDRWQAGLVIVPAGLMLLGLLLGRKWPRSGRPWVSGSFFMLLAGMAFLAIWFFPIENLPVPSGHYSVGVRDFELQDESRRGLIAAGPNEPRRLLVRVWYPAENSQDHPRRRYFKPQEADTTAESIGRLVGLGFLFKHLKHVPTNSMENAPLASGLHSLPVVVYSHGYTSFAGQNTALMEELASHGYVVFSVQHTFDSGPTVFPNGDVLDSDPELLRDMQAQATPSEATRKAFVGNTFAERREGQLQAHQEAMAANERIAARSTRVWTGDRVFVLDRLEAGAVPESVKDIVAAGDFAHTGQAGMSFGGSTTGEFCYIDPRCAAGVNLDGGDFHFTSFGRNQPVPFLMFYSDFGLIAGYFGGDPDNAKHGFNDFSYERPETAGLRADVVRLKVNSVTHLGVSDFTLFVRAPLRNALFGSIDSHDMIRIQNDFVLGFFDKYVRQLENGFPFEQFEAHKSWVEAQDLGNLRADWLQSHPQDRTVRVAMETTVGPVEIALYPERAPEAVAQFLEGVDAGAYDGGMLHRTRLAGMGEASHTVVASIAADVAQGDIHGAAPAGRESWWQPDLREATGIPNEAGTLALLPRPEGERPEFFINVNPIRVMEEEFIESASVGPGHVTIGRVLRGLPLLQQIPYRLDDPADPSGRTADQPDPQFPLIRRIQRLD